MTKSELWNIFIIRSMTIHLVHVRKYVIVSINIEKVSGRALLVSRVVREKSLISVIDLSARATCTLYADRFI